MYRHKNQAQREKGFTLIELLVVVAIIALLSSVILIALVNARQKSRDTKRLSDMVQMGNALELFFAYNKGYPADSAGGADGIPDNMGTQFISTIPKAPTPGDGVCTANFSPCDADPATPVPACVPANTYYYVPKGQSYVINGLTVYPDFDYYFCLGNQTGHSGPGTRILTPKGVK